MPPIKHSPITVVIYSQLQRLIASELQKTVSVNNRYQAHEVLPFANKLMAADRLQETERYCIQLKKHLLQWIFSSRLQCIFLNSRSNRQLWLNSVCHKTKQSHECRKRFCREGESVQRQEGRQVKSLNKQNELYTYLIWLKKFNHFKKLEVAYTEIVV